MHRNRDNLCNCLPDVKSLKKYVGLSTLWGALCMGTSPQMPIAEYFGSAQPVFQCNLQAKTIQGDGLYAALITRIYGEDSVSEIHLMGVRGKEQRVIDHRTFKISQILNPQRVIIECSGTDIVLVIKNKEKIHFGWTGTGIEQR